MIVTAPTSSRDLARANLNGAWLVGTNFKPTGGNYRLSEAFDGRFELPQTVQRLRHHHSSFIAVHESESKKLGASDN